MQRVPEALRIPINEFVRYYLGPGAMEREALSAGGGHRRDWLDRLSADQPHLDVCEVVKPGDPVPNYYRG
jgi:hypothetical protein